MNPDHDNSLASALAMVAAARLRARRRPKQNLASWKAARRVHFRSAVRSVSEQARGIYLAEYTVVSDAPSCYGTPLADSEQQ
jgi:hypothetical protein